MNLTAKIVRALEDADPQAIADATDEALLTYDLDPGEACRLILVTAARVGMNQQAASRTWADGLRQARALGLDE